MWMNSKTFFEKLKRIILFTRTYQEMESRKVRSGDKFQSKSKSSSKEKTKSKTSSSENRDKALDVMFNYALTKDQGYESLMKGIHQLSTVDKKLHTTVKRAKDTTEDIYNKKVANVKLKYKFMEFMNRVSESRKWKGMPTKEFTVKDVDAELVQQVERMRPITAYFHFAAEIRDQVRSELGPVSIYEISKETGRRWAEMSASQKAKWTKKALDEKESLEEFKKYVKDLFEQGRK